MLDRILPCLILVGVEVFVHLHVWLLNLGLCRTVEAEVQGFEDIPAELETTVPEEALAPCGRDRGCVAQILQVTFLQFIVGAVDIRIEGNVLGYVSQVLCLHNVQPLALTFYLLERFPWFPVGTPRVVHAALPVVLVLIDDGLSEGVL